jgi:magnesium transporter
MDAPSESAHSAPTQAFPKDSIGILMESPVAVFRPLDTVSKAVEDLRALVRTAFITYVYIVDDLGKLQGVVTMRELLFAEQHQPLSEIMLTEPFSLRATTPLMDAMKQVLLKHYPVYPVVDDANRLIGLVRSLKHKRLRSALKRGVWWVFRRKSVFLPHYYAALPTVIHGSN